MQFVDFFSFYNVGFWVNDNDEVVVFVDNNLNCTLVLSKWFAEYYTSVGFNPSFLDGRSVIMCDSDVFLESILDFKNCIVTYENLEGDAYQTYHSIMYYLDVTLDSLS